MSRTLRQLYEADPVMFAWWATEIECTSATARRQRLGQLREDVLTEGFVRLSALRAGWHEVEPGEEVRESAKRLLRVHDLRTADALQLAAAFFVVWPRPVHRPSSSCRWTIVFWPAARRGGFLMTRPTR